MLKNNKVFVYPDGVNLFLFYYLVGESPKISTQMELFTIYAVTKSSRPELFVVSSSRPGEFILRMAHRWSATEKVYKQKCCQIDQ